ncbi:MAG TPA: SO_0444 family Cu/Zn efflux transporter [Methylomirabilota bacterium]
MTEFLLQWAGEAWSILREASLFLLVGFTIAGVLAVLVPSRLFARLLGRGKIRSVLWASAVGAPIPLCSCGVLPAALGLARQGATKGATVSFLISTPETGIDSIALTYALMDPIVTVFRPIAGVLTAVVAGIVTNLWGTRSASTATDSSNGSAPGTEVSEISPLPLPAAPAPNDRLRRFRRIFVYAFRELLGETAHWLALGIALSALVAVLLPASLIERYLSGDGLTTMLLMFALGIPIYTCASASTPIAAALVLKGISPGAALVFLLSGPATNLGALVVLVKIMGRRVMAIYLSIILVMSVLAGYALDWVYHRWQVNPAATFGKAIELVPDSVNVAAALVMIGLLAWSVWRVPLPEEWIRVHDWFAALTGVRLTAARLRAATGIAVAALYLGSGLFTVHPGEVAIRTRFGRIVDSHLGPGLHARLPWPIEYHVLVATDLIRRIEVGFRSAARPAPGTQPQAWAGTGFAARTASADLFWFQKAKVSDESFLLTGDENLIDVAFTAEYQVKDPVAFLYGVADADAVVRSVTIAALRAVLATMTVDAVYTTKRDEVEQRVMRDVQRLLDTYGIGVRMVGINLLSVHAPEEVHAAFRDVASAQEDKVLIVNRATTFAQESVNLAEGDAAAMIESARAFKDEKVLQAEGDALAFTLREKEYRRAPDLTRFRLHLEALEEILPPAEKIVRPGRADVKDFDLWLLQPFGGKKGQ